MKTFFFLQHLFCRSDRLKMDVEGGERKKKYEKMNMNQKLVEVRRLAFKAARLWWGRH